MQVGRSSMSSTGTPTRLGFMSKLQLDRGASAVPSVVELFHGPSADWHEREAEDLFGLTFRRSSAAWRIHPA